MEKGNLPPVLNPSPGTCLALAEPMAGVTAGFFLAAVRCARGRCLWPDARKGARACLLFTAHHAEANEMAGALKGQI